MMITGNNNYCGKLDSVNMPLDNVALIEAAAGTGKTYNIQNLVARLIVEKNFAIDTLVIVTFTEKAAKELACRLRKMLELLTGVLNKSGTAGTEEQQRAQELLERFDRQGIDRAIQKARLEEALRNIDNCRVSTIHGFCFRLLSEYAFESSMTFKVRLEKNISGFINKLLKDFCRIKRYSGVDLPCWEDCCPDFFGKNVELLLTHGNLKLEYTNQPFNDENSIVQRMHSLQQQFVLLPEKTATLQLLYGKLNSIDKIAGDSYLTSAISLLTEIPSADSDNWRSWYELFQVIRSGKFLGRGKAGSKKDVVSNKQFVDDFVSEELLFTIAESYCQIVETDCKIFLTTEAVSFVRNNLDKWKKQENFLDYNDLLIEADRALQNERFRNFIQKKFNAGIIDEFQDTDPLQYSIFKAIFLERPDNRRLFMVGDPRQAIYSFRGGDMATYLAARRECIENNGCIYTLTTNFRSSGKMIDAFNTIFRHNNPFCTNEIVFETVEKPSNVRPGIKFNGSEMEHPLSAVYLPTCGREDIFHRCASEIISMLASDQFEIPDGNGSYRKITPGDIAVLAADNNLLNIIRRELESYNIPIIGERKGGIWQSAEAAELAKFMLAVLENNSISLVREALLGNICGVELMQLNRHSPDAGEFMLQWRLSFIEFAECWLSRGTAAFMATVIREFSLKSRLTAAAGGERTLSNYIQLGDLLAAAELSGKLSPRGVLKFLQEKIANGSEEDFEMLESDRHAVHLLTIHKSKGLQFPIVFLPQLSARQPLSRDGLRLFHRNGELCCNIDGLDQDARTLAGVEELQEIMRLVYVAITRACCFCRISWGKSKIEKNTPMTWLFAHQHCPNDDLQIQDFVNCRIPFTASNINIPEVMRQENLFSGFTPDFYQVKLTANIVEPAVVEPPRGRRYIISYSALNELNTENHDPYSSEDFSDRDNRQDDNEQLFAAQVENAGDISFETHEWEKLSGGIWDIPHGAAIGNAWHEILENTDFTRGIDRELMKNIMANYGFKDPEHLNASEKMFKRLLDYQLPCGMKLSTLTVERRLTELEFLLSSPEGFNYSDIAGAVNEYIRKEFKSNIAPKGFLNMHRGFFTGFVDMIFEYNNKLYIVDWKSNALGCCRESFFGDQLKQHMLKGSYPLQYLCYLAALLKYLEQRLQQKVDEQLYNEYVGGVYYIFLRGMMLDEPGGVFSAAVPYRTVRQLADVITCGNGA